MTRYRGLLAERGALFRLLPRAGPTPLLAMSALELVAECAPAATAVALGAAVERVVDGGSVVGPLVAIAVVLLAGDVSRMLTPPLQDFVARRIDNHVRRQVRAATVRPPGIDHLEDQGFRDDARLAGEEFVGRRGLNSAGSGAAGQLHLLFRFIGGAAAGAVVARYSVLLALGVALAMLWSRALLRRDWVPIAKIRTESVRLRREADYWTTIAGGSGAAKELRIFGLGDWAVDVRHKAILDWHEPQWRIVRRALLRQWPIAVLALVVGFVAFGLLTWSTFAGGLSLGGLASTLSGVLALSSLGAMGYEAYDIEQSREYVAALGRLEQRARRLPAATGARVPNGSAIRFDQVSFTYPGGGRPVIDGLDLDVPEGSSIAIVGLNGAGKTTLIKLLAGLYAPTSGAVIVGGTDLREADMPAWRRKLAVVFQDFIRYELPARDNIGWGAPWRSDEEALRRAARNARALEIVERLPAGWDAPLSRAFSGGAELSGGQWQRIALARALFAAEAGARVLVLDEPTASLDVRVEVEIFDRLLDLAADSRLTTILVSHRFSTVRRADRIAVLDGGRITETGTHDELVAARGSYARMFQAQAAQFGVSG